VRSCAIGFASVVGTAIQLYDSRATDAFAARASFWLCRGLFSCVATVPERDRNARVQQHCWARRVLCALPLHQMRAGWTALAIAELSTTGALDARTIRLLRRILFSCCPTVPMHDRDAWVQRRCSAGRVLCAQLAPDSQL